MDSAVFDGIPGEPEFSTVPHGAKGATVMLNAVLKADCDEAVPIRFSPNGRVFRIFPVFSPTHRIDSAVFDGIPGEPEFSTVPHGTNADHGD